MKLFLVYAQNRFKTEVVGAFKKEKTAVKVINDLEKYNNSINFYIGITKLNDIHTNVLSTFGGIA